MFVDSDDLVTDQSIDKLMDAAYLYQADIVEGAYESFNNKGKITYQFKQKSGRLTKNQIQGFAWGKVYKSELFLNLRFPVGYWFEDTIMRFYLYHIVSNIIGIEHCVYRYRKNTNGITHSANKSRKSIDTLFVYLDVYHDFSKLNIEYDLSDYEALLNHIKLSCLRTIGLTKNEKFAIFSFWCHYLDEHYTSYHTLNPYLIPFEQMLRHRRYKQYLYYSYFK